MKNLLSRVFTSFTLGIALFAGVLTTAAIWPAPPNSGTPGGFLGSIFNLNESGTGQLIVQSDKLGIGTTSPNAKLEVSGNVIANNPEASNHLTTREYVDNKVVAEGSSGDGFMCYYTRYSYSCGPGFTSMPGDYYPYSQQHRICCSVNSNNSIGKKIFITSVGYNGNLDEGEGGEKGADAKCQRRATAAGLNGTYKAWLLDGYNETLISDKFTDATYVNMAGQTVIRSFLNYDQTSTAWQTLKNPIYYDEYGDPYAYLSTEKQVTTH